MWKDFLLYIKSKQNTGKFSIKEIFEYLGKEKELSQSNKKTINLYIGLLINTNYLELCSGRGDSRVVKRTNKELDITSSHTKIRGEEYEMKKEKR